MQLYSKRVNKSWTAVFDSAILFIFQNIKFLKVPNYNIMFLLIYYPLGYIFYVIFYEENFQTLTIGTS